MSTRTKTEAKNLIKRLTEDSPKKGFAEIRLKDPKRTGTITLRDYTDLRDNSHRPYVDEHGVDRVLRIKAKVYLDLSKERDQLTYEQVRLHPIYSGANPILVLINHEEEDQAFVVKKDREAKVNAIVSNLKDAEVIEFARALAIITREGSSPSTVKRKIYDLAEVDPEKVLNAYSDPAREYKSLFQECLEVKVFEKKMGIFKYGDITIGTTREQCILWLEDNDDIIPGLRKEIASRNKGKK